MDSLIFEEINKVRTKPKSYIPYVKIYIENQEKMKVLVKNGKAKTTSFSGNMSNDNTVNNVKITSGIDLINKNINAANELINILKKLKPVKPLIFNKTIDSISDEHGKYLDVSNRRGHYGPNNQTIKDRFKNYNFTYITENISSVGSFVYIKKDVKPIIINLLVDSGIENRGHRKNILDPKVKFIGIYMSKKTCIQNFAF